MKSKQRGVSFIGLLFVGGILAFLGVIGAQIFPTATEYQTILKAVKKATLNASTVAEVRSNFEKTSAIENITSITSKELEVTKEGDKVVASFAYVKEFHIAGPAYLTVKYAGASK